MLDNVEITITPSPTPPPPPLLDVDDSSIRVRRKGSTSQVEGAGIKRRESASKLITKDGKVLAIRRGSDVNETMIAAVRRGSASSLSLISLPPTNINDAIIDAADALEKLGGKGASGAYSEHLWDLSTLSENYQCHIDSLEPNKSSGLTADQAVKNLEKYGHNVLTPPPKVNYITLF